MSDIINSIGEKVLDNINKSNNDSLRPIINKIKNINPTIRILAVDDYRFSIIIRDKNTGFSSIISTIDDDFSGKLVTVTVHDKNSKVIDCKTRYYRDVIEDFEKGFNTIKSASIILTIPDVVFTANELIYIRTHQVKMNLRRS